MPRPRDWFFLMTYPSCCEFGTSVTRGGLGGEYVCTVRFFHVPGICVFLQMYRTRLASISVIFLLMTTAPENKHLTRQRFGFCLHLRNVRLRNAPVRGFNVTPLQKVSLYPKSQFCILFLLFSPVRTQCFRLTPSSFSVAQFGKPKLGQPNHEVTFFCAPFGSRAQFCTRPGGADATQRPANFVLHPRQEMCGNTQPAPPLLAPIPKTTPARNA